MKNRSTPAKGAAKAGRFVLTRATAEKISAVEGMKLTERMKRLLDRTVGLTGDERRSLIKEQVRRE